MGNGHARSMGRPAMSGLVLGSGIGLRQPRPDRRALTISLAFHVTVVVGLTVWGVLAGRDAVEYETYRVRLYSPSAQVEGPPAPRPEVVQTIVQAPRPETNVTPPPQRIERSERPQVTQTETKPPEKKPEPVVGANAKADSPGGDNIDVDIDGAEFPYPAYLQNIITQINRFFRWSGTGNPENVIAFHINRDGTVGALQVVERSADYTFDIQTIEAVELAGRRGMFGPLPEGWVQDRLWIRFRFLPPGR
jgi:outer membrane biosynthesis protein TonB